MSNKLIIKYTHFSSSSSVNKLKLWIGLHQIFSDLLNQVAPLNVLAKERIWQCVDQLLGNARQVSTTSENNSFTGTTD